MRDLEPTITQIEEATVGHDLTASHAYQVRGVGLLVIVHDRRRQAMRIEKQRMPKHAGRCPFIAAVLDKPKVHDVTGLATALSREAR